MVKTKRYKILKEGATYAVYEREVVRWYDVVGFIFVWALIVCTGGFFLFLIMVIMEDPPYFLKFPRRKWELVHTNEPTLDSAIEWVEEQRKEEEAYYL